jgi:hypothetical protein
MKMRKVTKAQLDRFLKVYPRPLVRHATMICDPVLVGYYDFALGDVGDQMTDPCVDHDHETGEVRELLCKLCNWAIGFLREDPEVTAAATEYLLRYKCKRLPVGEAVR